MTRLRWRRSRRPIGPSRVAALGLLCVMVAGCGPAAPLEVAVREYSSSVQYGLAQATAPPSPAPAPAPIPLALGPQAVILPPPTITPIFTSPAPQACPSADPLQPALMPAGVDSTVPPANGTYPMREVGTYSENGTAQTVPTAATETVQNVSNQGNGAYSFDVADTAGGIAGSSQVTTTYSVVPQPAGGEVGGVATTAASGIYITKEVTAIDGPSGPQTVTFVPSPPILVLPFPAVTGTAMSIKSTYANSASSTPGDYTVIQLTGSIVGRGRVDACGTVLDAWEVQLSGTISSSTQNLQVTEDYTIGTEYGGLPLSMTAAYGGTDQVLGPQISSRVTHTIDVVPGAAS